MPEPTIPSLRAAAFVRSITRPPTKGPRSLMRTTTDLPVFKFSTLTFVPNGNERCAAVIAPGSQRSPDAVLLVRVYHDARPTSPDALLLNVRRETEMKTAVR